MKNLFCPTPSRGRQLVNRTVTFRTTRPEDAVEIAGAIGDDTARYVRSVTKILRGIKDSFRPGATRRAQFVNDTVVAGASRVCRPQNVSRLVENEIPERMCSINSPGKPIEYDFVPGTNSRSLQYRRWF